MYGYIYKITCTEGSFFGRFYIGQRKWSGDISKDKYKGSGKILKDYYKKYPKAYIKEILAIAESSDELDQLEKDYIHPHLHHHECLNINEGGNHCYDYRISEESRRKLSEALKGRTTWNKGLKLPPSHMKGKHHSDETKSKISEKKKGKPSGWKGHHPSQEAREKMSLAHKGKSSWNKGKSASEETRLKMSIIRAKLPVIQIDKNSLMIIAEYPSAREAQRVVGVSSSAIYKCCKKEKYYKTAGGYMWEFGNKQNDKI